MITRKYAIQINHKKYAFPLYPTKKKKKKRKYKKEKQRRDFSKAEPHDKPKEGNILPERRLWI